MSNRKTTEIVTKEAFTRWCKRQGRKTYEYADPYNCAFCQYLKYRGIRPVYVDPIEWKDENGIHQIPKDIVTSLCPSGRKRGTFDALARRLVVGED